MAQKNNDNRANLICHPRTGRKTFARVKAKRMEDNEPIKDLSIYITTRCIGNDLYNMEDRSAEREIDIDILFGQNIGCKSLLVLSGMDGFQLYTIVHFGRNIVPPKMGSIVSYVGGSTKLTTLRAHTSYEDFIRLLEETNEIHHENYKLYNYVYGCACTILLVQDFTVMINMHKSFPGIPFHIWIVNKRRVPTQNFGSGKGLSTPKDTGSGNGLSTSKDIWMLEAEGPLHHNSFSDHKPEYRGYPETNGKGLDPRRFGPLMDDIP
ncbi:hypothetical protein GIB67_027417 [Kingdonia uniflora]|uniref:Uncharacterized protein n=1 Tax=Kingdonia uniflora TaxID=39325 RepID=A0A7J7MFI3_9MAGN|nr:hypothetical protein GIB67_027417 [Kingdonia uniflora]